MFRSLSTAVLLLLFALPGVALAQGTGTLAGRVVDAASGETLPGANVRIEGTTLGAAANADGQYRIIGVPVGTYTVTASFIGYTPETVADVVISNGYTRDLNFNLRSGEELGTIVVEYERPLIQRDAIGAPRVTTGEQLQNLPIRGVAAVTALQGGVVAGQGGALNIRGGRGGEVAYYVDGVRVTGLVGVNQQAIQEQEMLIGTIPARYGDVQSGVISISTKTGRTDFFGSAEAITSRGLDSYGYNLASLSLGGPIVPGNVGFFVSGEISDIADRNPYGIPTLRLSDTEYDALQLAPQAISVIDADGNTRFVRFPADALAAGGVTINGLQTALRDRGVIAATDSIGANPSIIDAVELYTDASQFETTRGKDNPLKELTFNGNLNFDFGPANLRVGGGLATRDAPRPYAFTSSLYNRDTYSSDQEDSYRLYGTLRYRVTPTAFVQFQGEFQDYQALSRPNGFSEDVADALFYGDTDLERNPGYATASRYYTLSGGVFQRQFGTDSGQRPVRVSGLSFSLPGRANATTFSQSHNQTQRFSASATTQLGAHQIEFGGEYQQDTRRYFEVNGYSLAAFYNDGTVESPIAGFPNGVSSYGELPFDILRSRVAYWGYNFNGTQEADEQNIDGYFPNASGERTNTSLAPYRPRYYAGYIQDKIEFNDLVVQLGVRVDGFDNNTPVLKDLYALRPIVRAGSVGSAPAGVEGDWAVYYSGNTVVGYRDLDGNFYDDQGSLTTAQAIQTTRGGQVRETDEPVSSIFTDYKPQVTVMPRVGVSFPVTDRALFFASYNVTSQRPTEFAFAPLSSFDNLREGRTTRIANPNLLPERTTQYEIGFRQRLGEQAALSLSGFYRTQDNKIAVRNAVGSSPSYSTYFNADFTTTQGAEVNFDLRRTRGLAMTANYTLSFAAGTGSDATSSATVAWRGQIFPQSINPADFDQRHTANISLDYRFGAGEGPMIGSFRPLENFGINLLGQFGSGQRYTRLLPNTGYNVNDTFTAATVGDLNSATLPATSRLDLRLERQFALGFADSNLRAYLNIINLLNTRNVLAVYRSTGVPDNDGFVALNDSRLDSPGDVFNYQQFVGGPVNIGGTQTTGAGLFYSSPRQIRLGILFDF